MDYYPKAMHELDKDFLSVLRLIQGHTIVVTEAIYNLYNSAIQMRNYPGCIAEVGVYTGGTLKLLSLVCPDKKIYGFDTFSGLPQETKGKDNLHVQGQFCADYNKVKDFLSSQNNIILTKGIFPDTANVIDDKDVFSLVHIDVDLYAGYKACLEFFYPRMVAGGIIQFDDYGWSSCEGAYLAVQEFMADKPERVFCSSTGHAMMVKSYERL